MTEPLAHTLHGTPVYGMEATPELLVGAGRMKNPSSCGPLAQYIAQTYDLPVVILVRLGTRFTRAFKVDTGGMLNSINIYKAVKPKVLQRLRDQGWVGRSR